MPDIPSPVLVTGASTGIGRATVRALVGRGVDTVASVRSDADAQGLLDELGEQHLTVLQFDITDSDAVTERISSLDALGAIVNNAGTAVPGPLEYLDPADLRWQLEVNTVGHVVATQAALPLLREHGEGARIVNIGSMAGRVSGRMVGAYSMSKFAMAAFSDALAQELEPFGIGVALIEPGAIDTEIWETSTARSRDMLAAMPEEARERYADMVEDTLKVGARSASLAISPDRVVKVIIDVLTARHPRPRNLVGIDAKAAGLVARLPTELRTPILKQVL